MLGTEPKVLQRYHQLLAKAFERGEPDDGTLAFRGDGAPACDEWGHAALAARCTRLPGYPETGFDSGAERLELTGSGNHPGQAGWRDWSGPTAPRSPIWRRWCDGAASRS